VLLPTKPPVTMHVATLAMHGMAPWARASTLPAVMRALLLALTAWAVASVTAYAVLRGAVRARLGAILVGAAGPLAALGLLRLLERADARPLAFTLLLVAGPAACAALAVLLSRLRYTGHAASTWIKV
jgi:hypothetical protein